MSRELLEEALKKTQQLEEREMKKAQLAENLGKITGVAFAVSLDTTAVWLIIKFMLGVTAFTWVNALGVIFLANLAYIKLKN